MMSLEKATIVVEIKGSETKRIKVLFNPNEYNIDSSNKFSWKSIPGLSQPIPKFVSGEASTLSMELFFDTTESDEDVRIHTQEIVGLLDIEKDLHAPPLCTFMWGSLSFKGLVEKVGQRYTMFNQSGIPIRATLNVTFKAAQTMKQQLQRIPRQSADRTKQRTVKQGEKLWQIAAEEYEDPALWRAIAKANDLKNPSQLEAGTLLKIPRLYS